MAIVNYSIPDDIKERFNQVFAGQNKSHVIAELMESAIVEHERQQQRSRAIDALLKLRAKQKPVSDKQIRVARRFGRL